MEQVRFENRVAIVTGAGGALGQEYARLLASRGAKVVVNDLGATIDGSGSGPRVADAVVEEIRSAGGEAVSNYDSVTSATGATALVQTALDRFGRLDIVINNAGTLRDVSFRKMSEDDWNSVLDVHLTGTMRVTKAAWATLRDAGYGRIVNTTSAAGLYGNFGQANYSAAKMGVVGLTCTLAQEGAKYGILVNAVAPVAKSRMTETILDAETLRRLDPAFVSPLVAWLCAEGNSHSGRVYAVGGGYAARVAVCEAAGVRIENPTPENVAAQWSVVNDLQGARPFAGALDAVRQVLSSTAE